MDANFSPAAVATACDKVEGAVLGAVSGFSEGFSGEVEELMVSRLVDMRTKVNAQLVFQRTSRLEMAPMRLTVHRFQPGPRG